MSDQPLFSTAQLAARAAALAGNAPAPAPEPTDASESAKRGPGRPRKLQAVREPSEADKRQAEWEQDERIARAKALGVTVESLTPQVYEENWRERLPQARPPAKPSYAGLYHLTGGAVCMPGGLVAEAGTVVRLNAEDGQHITERLIGKRVSE